MRIKILRGTVIASHPGARVGDIIDIDSRMGGMMVSTGRAVLVLDAPQPPELPPQAIETREPEVEHREPEIVAQRPKRRAGRLP